MVWRPPASVQSHAKNEKVYHDGAVKRFWHNTITNVPHDEVRNVSTAMSSNKRVRRGDDYLTGVDVTAVLFKSKNGETNA